MKMNFLLFIAVLILSSGHVDASALECHAEGYYSICTSDGMCQNQISQGIGVAKTQAEAVQQALTMCTQHMTNMMIISMGEGRINSNCRVTRCE